MCFFVLQSGNSVSSNLPAFDVTTSFESKYGNGASFLLFDAMVTTEFDLLVGSHI